MSTVHFLSLRGKISFWIALLSILGLLAVSAVVFAVASMGFEARSEEVLVGKADQIQHLLSEENNTASDSALRHALDDFLVGHGELKLQIRSTDGKTIYTSDNFFKADGQYIERRFEMQSAMQPGKALEISLSYDSSGDRSLLNRVGLALLAAALLGATVISVGGFFLVTTGLKPLSLLALQIRQVSAQNLNIRLSNSDLPSEIVPLVFQFNGLLDRLDNAYRQMEGFNADLAHELFTPVATLIASVETTLLKADLNRGVSDLLVSNLEELQRISGIVQDMLFVSQSDRGVKARRMPVSSVAEIAEQVADYYDAAIDEAKLRLLVLGDSQAQVDIGLIQRALSNLLSNAIRYATPDTALSIEISSIGEEQLQIMVCNEGTTIQAEHLPRLFDRFYRADNSRIHSDANHGLGLAIVEAVAKMHGGRGIASSEKGHTRIGLQVAKL